MFLLDQSGNGYLEYNFMSKWFYDIFFGAATGSVNCDFFLLGMTLVSWSLAIDERGGY
jgi:hypothetical protein